jgi:ABC-type polysaccharide/polyol phosphate export permease
VPEPSAAPLDSELVIEARPATRRAWATDLWRHREVFAMLARKEFQTRYKRASFGVLWAVAVPLLQGLVMAVVFSRIVRLGAGREDYGAYVFSGVIAFSFFAGSLSTGVTAIVDASGLTDKVWFPRVLLSLVPVAANLVSLVVSLGVLVLILPLMGGAMGVGLLLLIPGVVLLAAFTAALTLVVSALHVYFRDVKFFVQAALMVWIYMTPIIYPKEMLGGLAGWIDLNPMTGIVTIFHTAAIGGSDAWLRPVGCSVVATVLLGIIGLEAQRHHDRRFVDLL